MLKYIIFILAAVLPAFFQVSAQNIHLGPVLGYQEARDADNGKLIAGGALRLKLSKGFGVEASINYRSETYSNGALTVKSWPVMITGLIYPIPILYGGIGIGWYNTTFDYDQTRAPFFFTADETQQKIGWHFGGGLELPIGSTSLLIADFRYVFIDYDFNHVPGFGTTNSDFVVVTFGLLLSL